MFLLVTNFIFATNIPALYVRLCSYATRLFGFSDYRQIATSRRCRVRASSIPNVMVRSR